MAYFGDYISVQSGFRTYHVMHSLCDKLSNFIFSILKSAILVSYLNTIQLE